MILSRLITCWGLNVCMVAAMSIALPAFAQTRSERAAFACMQLDEESAYSDLQNLGWQELRPTEITVREREILATEHFLTKAQKPDDPHRKQSFKETAEIASSRVEQQMSRNFSNSNFLGGAVLKSRSTQDLVSIQTKNLLTFEGTVCTFFFTQDSAPELFAHALRSLQATGIEDSYVARVGDWNSYHDGVERRVSTYLWDTSRMSGALQQEFHGELMVVASVWRHDTNNKGDD